MIATEDTIQVTPPRPRKEKKNRDRRRWISTGEAGCSSQDSPFLEVH
jgi:hypothetical protein